MSKKSILIIIAFILLISIFIAGYNSKNEQIQIKGGLKIYSWSSALGSESNTNLDNTKFSYSVNLTNENEKNIFIKSIQPIINETIQDKIISKDILVDVNRNIKPNETIEINGDIIIDTKGLTKSDIQKLKPFITDIKVISEEIVSLKK